MICNFIFIKPGPSQVKAAGFAYGADIGWLQQMEATGYKFYNDSGAQQDCLQILKDHGIDSIRLRVWVNPSSDRVNGHCSKAEVVAMAVRAQNMGFRIMIDFHYSDSWADPGKQVKPAAWSSHSFSQLLTDVYNHTYDVLNTLKSNGVIAEWVQVGNEITPGMLLPDGSTSNWSQLAQLINRGYDAVKAVSSSTKVILHIDQGNNNSRFRTWFDNAKNNGAKYDVIGASYYPYWLGSDYTATINNLGTNLNDMASRYGKEVMVVEVGGDYTKVQNTYDMLAAVINKVKAVPNAKGLGVVYWEPEGAKSWSGYQLSCWGDNGRPTAALDAFIHGGSSPTPTQGATPTPTRGATPTPTRTSTPTPTIPGGTTNLALNKTASADSQQSNNIASYGNDGNTSTRWCAANGNTGHWWKVDLGQSYNLTGSEVTWESATNYKYRIETSTDNNTWTTSADKTANTSSAQVQSDSFSVNARYVRITVTGLASGRWASFFEFKVFGGAGVTSTPTPTRGATATPTSRQSSTGTPTVTPTPTRANTPTPTQGSGTGNYMVTYTISSDWGSGGNVDVTIKNNSSTTVNGWTLAWTFPGNQTITNLWNGTYTQSGASVSVKDAGYNAMIGANGGTTSFGFGMNYSGTNAKPTSFTLNGTACTVQ
jgi:arabinogalactan endo-1,4-beta-galactosidase